MFFYVRLLIIFTSLTVISTTTAFAETPQQTQEQPEELPRIIELFEAQRDHVVSVQTEMAAPMGGFSPFFRNDGEPVRGQGSGFIVDENGLTITNWHVVSGAQSIQVTMADGSAHPARLIGADPTTDIALIQIDAPNRLASVRLGRSQDIQPGQWVVAIGSPFGLEHSVTVGVLSATGRQIGVGAYDNFLQTDASINPGNSGGPLFNLDGEVVGVNTAIIRNGRGIGFAVPVDTITEILPQLRDRGHVVRGFLGAGVQDMSPDLAETAGLEPRDGVLLRSVDQNGPAQRAGLLAGDVITQIGATRTEEASDLLNTVARITPGESARVIYRRESEERQTEVTVTERPDPDRREIERTRERARNFDPDRLGVVLLPMSRTLAARVGSPPGVGVYVDRVEAGSPASGVLQQGDVLLQIGEVEINDPSQVPRVLRDQPRDRPIRILIRRGGEPHFVAIRFAGE